MCAFSVYAEDLKRNDTDYGACFVLAIISWLLSWTATTLGAYKLFTDSQTGNTSQEGTATHTHGAEYVAVTMSQHGSAVST